MWRKPISIFFALLLFHGSLNAQEQPRQRKPNTTISEILIDYGRTRERSEDAVLQQARNKAFDGDYLLKSIGISGYEDNYYCIVTIQHDIYRPLNRKAIQEMTVGYGRTMALAEIDARYKAERMINERLNSATERRARKDAMEAAQKRQSAAGVNEPVILDKDEDTSYILKSIRFSGSTDDYLCYIKFEYMVMK
ncbi:hypothetical protein [Cerasicoccus maritimus]|uniref:hypothetical protein n=1 Tax=Cerasicoccus maritimus TaxID=490089 RepID=UPI002852BC99|nr:hypothetical protein [Cerasicoccus maritimus]